MKRWKRGVVVVHGAARCNETISLPLNEGQSGSIVGYCWLWKSAGVAAISADASLIHIRALPAQAMDTIPY